MELRGSESEKNLLKAFAGESQARNRYSFFASVAKKEGFEQIAEIFQETADNEKEHAEIFFKYLSSLDSPLDKDQTGQGKHQTGQADSLNLEIVASYPAGRIGTTKENLLAAADGEKEEWSVLYPDFERIAREEGFEDVADSFKEISEVEEYHERRYRKLLKNVKEGAVFEREEVVKWKCRNCGYVHEGEAAPDVCPACRHAKAYYEIWVENY